MSWTTINLYWQNDSTPESLELTRVRAAYMKAIAKKRADSKELTPYRAAPELPDDLRNDVINALGNNNSQSIELKPNWEPIESLTPKWLAEIRLKFEPTSYFNKLVVALAEYQYHLSFDRSWEGKQPEAIAFTAEYKRLRAAHEAHSFCNHLLCRPGVVVELIKHEHASPVRLLLGDLAPGGNDWYDNEDDHTGWYVVRAYDLKLDMAAL